MNDYIKNGENYLINCIFDGLAHSYDVVTKEYVKPYPEVTGYILSYFCENYETIEKKIIGAADHLVAIQDKKTGGYGSFVDKCNLYSFDTAQILMGLLNVYKRTKEEKYLLSAEKAGRFLIDMQLDCGSIIPVYDKLQQFLVIDKQLYKIWNGPWSGLMGKITEAFNLLYECTNEKKYLDAKNKANSFYKKADYIECTHPLGYWLEGLDAAGEGDIVRNVLKDKVIPRIHDNGYIAYEEKLSYSYVSGNVQLGILLLKYGFADCAKKIRDYARVVQSKNISGGLFQYADSQGNLDYHIHTEINSWGTKYYCQLERLMEGKY